MGQVARMGNARNNRCSVAAIVVKSRIEFYFSPTVAAKKKCEKCPLRGMLHSASFRATCVTAKLRDKLHETLPSITPPLQPTMLTSFAFGCISIMQLELFVPLLGKSN